LGRIHARHLHQVSTTRPGGPLPAPAPNVRGYWIGRRCWLYGDAIGVPSGGCSTFIVSPSRCVGFELSDVDCGHRMDHGASGTPTGPPRTRRRQVSDLSFTVARPWVSALRAFGQRGKAVPRLLSTPGPSRDTRAHPGRGTVRGPSPIALVFLVTRRSKGCCALDLSIVQNSFSASARGAGVLVSGDLETSNRAQPEAGLSSKPASAEPRCN